MAEHRLTELGSGLRVVTEFVPGVRSVALGFWIGTGSRAETHEQAGLSHLLEHLLFRGSARFSSLEIDEIFDSMGAELNAGTGKETTSVHSRVLDRHLPRAFDVLSDMVWHPAFEDVDTERRVILQEIAMYEDDPQDKVFDVLGEAVFGPHPLGRAIIGRAEVIAETPLEVIERFHAARYVTGNTVVAAAGSLDHDDIVAMAAERLPDRPGGAAAMTDAPAELYPRVRFEAKETEQYHVCLGAPAIARDDDRRFALRVLDNVLGGTSSSRLFQQIRERRGLAYSVYSFSHLYAGIGQVGIYLGTEADSLPAALEVVADELARLCDCPATPDELERAKENVKGRLVLSLESTSARMNRLGSHVLTEVPLLGVDELIERVDAVTVDDLEGLASELFAAPRMSAACIGPHEETFREALEPVSPVLAAA
ncbi:MAG TPA: pitrilysin family protein [Solirubrobacteraceae bacterium]|nr:pitrilysin family protein [Solirubrobacteraceae bacterium]